MDMTRTVLILGASGGFGRNADRAFSDAGWTVRRFRRGTDMAKAAMGADVIVNAMNPPNYHNWDVLLPQITAEVIAAARASGATVILPGNVYVYGDQPGPWGPETPHQPVARKGAIRAQIEADYRAAAAKGVRTIILRGGDFIDPGNAKSVFQMLVLKNLRQGRVMSLGNADRRRAYAYLPDMARAAVALADLGDQLPAFADIPFPGLTLSIRDLAHRLEARLGHPLRITGFPWWTMRVASPVWELARELTEMRYLFDTDHELDGEVLRNYLPDFDMTSLDGVIEAQLTHLDIHPDKAVA
jgi:nucleoside-diphosphate-sugar epimerase